LKTGRCVAFVRGRPIVGRRQRSGYQGLVVVSLRSSRSSAASPLVAAADVLMPVVVELNGVAEVVSLL
jgi:hypothetical protein